MILRYQETILNKNRYKYTNILLSLIVRAVKLVELNIKDTK